MTASVLINTGLVCLDTAAKLNNAHIDMYAIVKEYGINTTDIEPSELIRIAKNSGFKIKIKNLKLNEISEKYPMPAIIRLNDKTYWIILGVNKEEKRALFLPPLAKHPVTKDIDEFQKEISDIFILSYKGALKKESDAKFGFKWFFNEILKYKTIIFQVLLGSFVVQLFGLTTPLFTQVILDKVLVHRTISTLNVLGFAFLTVAFFEFLLNLSRNYEYSF